LTPDLKDKPLNAAAVPLLMTVDNQTFVDNESLDVDGFIRKMNEFNENDFCLPFSTGI
jgi:hypothetical protein